MAIAAGVACSADGGGGGDGGSRPHDSGGQVGQDTGGPMSRDVTALDVNTPDVQYNPDAFFATDPPAMTCGADGAVEVDAAVPGGTPECPADKNREGCECDTPGMMASCWPGLRANRNHGICHDGMTTCMPTGDVGGRWGPCVGYTLPMAGATLGANACMCFSSGTWAIANLSPCFEEDTSTHQYYSWSSIPGATGTAACANEPNTGPPTAPPSGSMWSTDSLQVDCTGQWTLCYTLKAGDGTHPSASDCQLSQVCSTSYYAVSGVMQTFPPLPVWLASGTSCATRFATTGGYGEMSVQGVTGDCQHINDPATGGAYVFNRVQYCPLGSTSTTCMTGGSGMF